MGWINTGIGGIFSGLVLFAMAPLMASLMAKEAWAEEAAPVEEAEVRYLPLQPAFVCNFGLAHDGHMMYVKTDISVRLSSRDAEVAARNHLPALRNSLVLLLSRQDEASVSSSAGRESIRNQALAELNEILLQEEGVEYIDDLMFTNFVVQR